jgi:hypothetical protein
MTMYRGDERRRVTPLVERSVYARIGAKDRLVPDSYGYDLRMASTRVRLGAGVSGIVLAPVSLLVAGVAVVALAFTPLGIAGPSFLFGYAFAAGGIVAILGPSIAVESILHRARAPRDAQRRAAAYALGIAGAMFCTAAIVRLVELWVWIPGQVVYTPYGS